MLSTEEVEALAARAGLSPETLAWMTEAPRDERRPAPLPALRYAYDRLSEDEWAIVSPLWGSANQASTSPRDVVDALLKLVSTGCKWNDVADLAPPEAARLQYRRRLISGALAALADAVRGKLGEARVRQFELLTRPNRRWAR